MAIHENSTVKVIGGFYDGKTGKVLSVYPNVDIAVVSFHDNGDVGKVSLSALVEIQAQESKIVDVKIEIPEGAKKISRADFDAALKRVTSPDHVLGDNSRDPMGGFMRSITTMIVAKNVGDEIFKDQDVVIMMEDEFISALWSACNPISVAENVQKKVSARKCMTITMTALIGFEEVVAILFGAENG